MTTFLHVDGVPVVKFTKAAQNSRRPHRCHWHAATRTLAWVVDGKRVEQRKGDFADYHFAVGGFGRNGGYSETSIKLVEVRRGAELEEQLAAAVAPAPQMMEERARREEEKRHDWRVAKAQREAEEKAWREGEARAQREAARGRVPAKLHGQDRCYLVKDIWNISKPRSGRPSSRAAHLTAIRGRARRRRPPQPSEGCCVIL